MDKIHIQLSKFGDVASILPILHAEFLRTKEPQNLVISESFASILEGCSYVTPHIWKGNFGDLKGAIKWAKQQFDDVIVLQTHGIDFPFQHKTPSFQIDQYLRAGRIAEWDKLPLIFDQRDKRREYQLLSKVVGRKKQPFILLADESQSSPFEKKEELAAMLTAEFGSTHKIIKLSEMKAEKIFDLVGLYDKADALVTVETAHVHLSKASDVPKIVLAADGWRGSAYSDKFRFYCRYGEWDRRKHILIRQVRSVIEGVKSPKVHVLKTTFKDGYNLSITENGIGIYRYHPNGDWKTKLAIVLKSGETFPLNEDDLLRDYSIEDARCFTFNGKLHATYTVGTAEFGQFRCYQAYGEITEKDGVWNIGHIQSKYIGNDFSEMQKNWTPFVHDGKLHLIYGIKTGNQIVLEMDGNKVVAEHTSPAPVWANGEIRGGCVLPHDDSLLRFFHSRADYLDKSFRYFIGASLMENQPPFRTVMVGKTSILFGNESFTPNCKHWKKDVVFPLGCSKEGDKFLLSVGLNDSKCAVVELTKEQLGL